MVESQLHVKQSCLPSLISKWNVTNSKNELLKTVRLTTSFQNNNCILFQSSPCLSTRAFSCIMLCYLYPHSLFCAVIYVSLNLVHGVLPLFEFWWISWYSSFNSLCLLYSKHPHIRTHDFRVQADLVLIYWVLSEKSVRCS